MDLEDIKRYALLNAAQHEGKADAKAVLGKILAENSEARKNIKKIMVEIKKVIVDVNKLGLTNQQAEMEKLGIKIEKETKEAPQEKTLPPLPKVSGRVIMRFAPNPDGPLSLGRSRQALLNWWYAQQYDGDFILRFDDTDPKVKTPMKEAYDWILEDLRWLGIEPETVAKASDRLKIYYDYAEKLIKEGKAYICICSAEHFKQHRLQKKECPCRNLSLKDQLNKWQDMFSAYKEGEAVLRIKTDMNAKNPAIRDWPAMRIVDKPKHPFSNAKVWPLYDFASAIDDHEFGITHVIRGRDFEMSEIKQGFIYKHFGWKYPVNIVTGKLIVAGVKSTTASRKAIEARELKDWEDPRLPTLMALRKRGFAPEAIAQFIRAAGLTKGDVQVSLENLESLNRKLIDFKANRYFFVAAPLEMEISGAEPQTAKLLLHPDEPERGERILHFKKVVLVSKDDMPLLKENLEIRLKDLFNVRIDKIGAKIHAAFTSKEMLREAQRKLQIIQWLPQEEKVPLTLIMPDASEKNGFAEAACKDLKNATVQFERVGFAVVNKIDKDSIAYYTHR